MKRQVLMLVSTWAIGASAAEVKLPAAAPLTFLQDFCVRCHGAEKQKGDVRLDDLTGNVLTEGTRWSTVLHQVREHEMPPEEAKKQPSETQRQALAAWVKTQLGAHAQRKPNLGNLVPHEMLFGQPSTAGESAPAPRLWRLDAAAYKAWVSQVSGNVQGIMQPFTAWPERGIKDFAALSQVDEPTTEVLLRNAETIVAKQTAFELVEGEPKPARDAVREYVALLRPGSVPERAQLERVVQRQFQLALGRRPGAEELAPFLDLYERCARGGDQAGALRTMLTAVLLRAEAVFRFELGGAEGRLTGPAAAQAISLALSDRPYFRLVQAAEKGECTTREQIAALVRGVLDDPKAPKPRVLEFFREYFEYDQAPDVFKDRPSDLMHEPRQLVADTDQLIKFVLEQDRDVFRALLTTPLTFVNARTKQNKETRQPEFTPAVTKNPNNNKGQQPMESLFGLEAWTAEQPITMPADTRAGVLMQPSWLVAWSESFNNDIVRRGRFIRERLLGGTVPDLPIGVAAMIPDEKDRTLRDRVSSATRDERCWKCHQYMDELGLPFEQFDHFGRRTAAERAPRERPAARTPPLRQLHVPAERSGAKDLCSLGGEQRCEL